MIPSPDLYKGGFIRDPYSIFHGERSLALLKVLDKKDVLNDRILAQEIYNTNEKYGSFRKLKSRYNHTILDELFYNTFDRFHSSNRNEMMVYQQKKYTTILVLKHTLLNEAYIKLLLSLKNEAEKIDNIVLLPLIYRDLYAYYAFIEPNFKEMQKIKLKKKFYDEELVIFNRVFEINGEMSFIYMTEKLNLSKESKRKMTEWERELEHLQNLSNGYDVQSFAYDLRAFPLLINKQYEQLLHLMNETEAFMSHKGIVDKSVDWTIQLHRLLAYFFLNRIDEAIAQSNIMTGWLTRGNRFWLLIQNYKFIAKSYNQDFQGCVEILEEVFMEDSLKIFKTDRSLWELRLAFFQLNQKELGIRFHGDFADKLISSNQFFRRNKELLRDKKSMNLPYRIIEIFYLIERGQFSKIADIIDSLYQFKYRYLKDDETYRSQCFVRLLEVLEKSSFHPVRTKLLAEPILKKMRKKDIVIDNESVFPEILPFEQVWNLMMIKITK